MYTNQEVLQNYQISFPLEKYTSLEKILFLDIETTGLSPSSSQLYLIGIAYYEQSTWHIKQWFAQNEFVTLVSESKSTGMLMIKNDPGLAKFIAEWIFEYLN